MDNEATLSPAQEAAIKSILGEETGEEYRSISLPSNGLLYSKDVELRPFTFADEKRALKSDVKKSDFVNVLLENCLKGVGLNNLLLCDKLFLMYKLKEFSTGSTMNLSIRCEECDADANLGVDLSILNVNYLPEKTEFPFKFNLPVLKKEVVITPATVQDERLVTSFESLSNNLWRFVESINNIDDKKVIAEVIPQLPVEDVHSIMKYVNMSDCGIDTKTLFLCSVCSNTQEVEVPLTTNFFGGN